MVELKSLFKLAPALAIKYFKKKSNTFTWDWYELWQDAHKKSFTVAKVMREDILKDNKEVNRKLLDLATRGENLRPLMKNIAGIFAYSTEENFKEEGRPKWQDLAESTKKQRKKKGTYPGLILQVTGQLASSVNTYYDDDSAVIGSNLDYAAIHQLGGQAGKEQKAEIPARPYLQLTHDDFAEIIDETTVFLK